MSKKHGINLLVSDYAFYADKEDHIVQTVVLEGSNKLKADLYMKSEKEFNDYLMYKLGLSEKQTDEILSNNNQWAKKFDNFELKYEWRLADSGGNELKQCIDIIKKNGRMKWDNPEYVSRLREEIEVIAKNGKKDLSGYFLPIVEVLNHPNSTRLALALGCESHLAHTAGTRKPVMRIVIIQKLMMPARCCISAILARNNTMNPATSATTAAKLGMNMVRMVS